MTTLKVPELELEFTFEDAPETIHCPACGANVTDTGTVTPCEHLICYHHDHVGEFELGAPQFAAALEAFENRSDDDLTAVENFRANWEQPHAFCIALTYAGMSCGPYSETMRFFFQFPGPADEASEDDR